MSYHIAQANFARMVAPIDDPTMAEFVDLLDPINAIADGSPGFVWRLKPEDGTVGIFAFEDPRVLFNMSVWEDVDSLEAFTYRSRHIGLIRDRTKWFHPPDRATAALWWVSAGTEPTAAEGRAKLEHLWEHGPTPEAFTFAEHFPHPSS